MAKTNAKVGGGKSSRKSSRKSAGKTTGKKGSGKTIASYVASLDPDRRLAFGELRDLVSKQLPGAKLTMAYSMPTWEIGEPWVAAASQKSYLALYCCKGSLLEPYRRDLSHLDVGKCCIRFKRMEDLPVPVVKKLLRDFATHASKKAAKA